MNTCETCTHRTSCVSLIKDSPYSRWCSQYEPNFTPVPCKGKYIEFKKFEPLPSSIPIQDVRINAHAILPYVDCTECKRELQVKTYQHCLDKIQEYLKKRIPTDVYDELVEDFDNIYKVLEAELNGN